MTTRTRGVAASLLFIVLLGAASFAFADKDASDKRNASQKDNHVAVCVRGNQNADVADCHARVTADKAGNPNVGALPAGYGPAQLHAAYTPQTQAANKTIIAIVDAYDNPNVHNDLNTYSRTFGIPTLPQCNGPIASSPVPCFQKMNQNGGSKAPSFNAGWALEIALDVQVAHAMCQNCSILLVEANSNSYADLMTAVDRAVMSGANVVSNSYGSPEFSAQTTFDHHFNVPGVAFTVSTGDSGYGVQYPASSQYVTAVGGTTLTMNGLNYVSETAWSGAGSGCSAFEPKPVWQNDTLCSNRTVADVSAVADPNTGAAVYVSTRIYGQKGWFKVGGTSLAAPVIAGIYALSGNTAGAANSIPYSNPSALRDITSGSTGSCGGTYLCTAVTGFDGPTGLGTPNGLLAF
jgi:subtilase family serine protease